MIVSILQSTFISVFRVLWMVKTSIYISSVAGIFVQFPDFLTADINIYLLFEGVCVLAAVFGFPGAGRRGLRVWIKPGRCFGVCWPLTSRAVLYIRSSRPAATWTRSWTPHRLQCTNSESNFREVERRVQTRIFAVCVQQIYCTVFPFFFVTCTVLGCRRSQAPMRLFFCVFFTSFYRNVPTRTAEVGIL